MEPRKIAGLVHVHESVVDSAEWLDELTLLKYQAVSQMAKLGRIDVESLEVELVRPAELDGIKLPIGEYDGVEIPNNYVILRFSALAYPYDEDRWESDGGS